VAEGTQGKLRELLEWLQTGPNAARGYHTEWADHSGEFENNKFELKRKDVDEKSFEQQWVWMAMCAVCMAECPMAILTDRVIDICGHNICSGCFTGMLVASQDQDVKCPMCRSSIPRQEGDPVAAAAIKEQLNLQEEYQLGQEYYGDGDQTGYQITAEAGWTDATQSTDAQWYSENGEGDGETRGEWHGGAEGQEWGLIDQESTNSSTAQIGIKSWHADLREDQSQKKDGAPVKEERAAKAPIKLGHGVQAAAIR
jgi:hypothetical protein